MSRIGKKVIAIPAGVTVSLKDDVVTVKGSKGTLTQVIDDKRIIVKIEGAEVSLSRTSDDKVVRGKHGLYRALIANMIEGVTKGFTKVLQIAGIGYKVAVSGKKLTLNIGFSHPIEVEAEEGISFNCPSNTEIEVSGIDKVQVGAVAASIRAFRKPEPYHGYGIKYKDEVIERKEGKAAGKK